MANDDYNFTARGMEPEDWEMIKLEVYGLYMVKNNTLESVQARLQAIYGFQACTSKWKDTVKEWNYIKKFPASTMHAIVAVKAQRAQKRKRTVFSCGGTPITQKRIEKFEKRRCRGVAPPIFPALPSNIRYHTPSSENEGDSSEEGTYGNLPVCLSTSTSSSLGHACSVCTHQCEIELGETHRINFPDEPWFSFIGSIDRWLLDEHQPWSHLEFSRQINSHDDTVVNDHNLSNEFREFGLPSEEYGVWLDLPYNMPQPFLESRSILIVEQEDTVCEEVALKDPSTFADKLKRYLRQNREYTPQALIVRFELAEALIDMGKYDEAEDHCHHLIAIDSQESVAALLGRIFAKTDRLEESTTWFFIALANFILDCTNRSFQQNMRLYWRIYYLFAELLWLTEQDLAPLTKTFKEMMETLDDLRFDEDIPRACPELLIHGFHFAHNCAALKLVNSAKYLYQHLLEPPAFYFNGRHIHEKAKAHQMYGQLLIGEENWISSAEQLLLACESTIQSGLYTHQYVAFLTITFNNLRIHLPSEDDKPDSTVKTIETKLDYMMNQISVSHIGYPVLPVENHLQSSLLGLRCAVSLADISAQAQLTLPIRSIVPSQGRTNSNCVLSRSGRVSDDVKVSKKSASTGPVSSSMSGDGSHENGQTWPMSECDEHAGIDAICDMMSIAS